MVILDLILIIIVIATMIRGWQLGVVRQGIIVFGLVLGFWLGVVVVPLLAPFFISSIGRSLGTILVFGVTLLLLGSFFDWLAHHAKRRITKKGHHQADGVVGVVFGGLYALVLIWLASTIFLHGPSEWLSDQIQRSIIIRQLDKTLPEPPSAVTKIQRYIANINTTRPFVNNEPSPERVTGEASQAELDAIFNKNRKSVVEITGRGCGAVLEGTGFVAAPNVVMTNAHVIGGVARPVIRDDNGLHQATVIYFNPDLDIALLRTTNLAGAVLPLNTTTQPRGTFGAVMGYPNGGGLTGVSGYVNNSITAVGRNIYNEGFVRRNIYSLSADVQHGNSGGPYILSNGEVAGVIFARSESYDATGYAIKSSEVASLLAANKDRTTAVSTQRCSE